MPTESEATVAGRLRGFLALPDGPGPHPGVVVLHELFGLNGDIRSAARRFAGAGYAALAPDLLAAGNRVACLTRVLADLSRGASGRTLDDVEAARSWLAARAEVDGERVAVAGFCMGGAFALVLAARGGVRAAAVNYGAVPKHREELDGVCPVVASYGRRDLVIGSHGRRLEEHLAGLGVPHDVKTYDGVGHSFMNQPDGAGAWLARLPSPMRVGYSEPEAEDAWSRMLAFFGEHV